MIDGRQGDSLAAFRVGARFALIWLAAGVVSLFVANTALGLVGFLLVLVVLATLWLALFASTSVDVWQMRTAGLTAALPVVPVLAAMVAALLLIGPVLYWSHVAPSWLLLMRRHAEFAGTLAGGPKPVGVFGIERASGRVAFLTVNGMLGSWRAIVYDPTGRLAAARGWGGGSMPSDIRYLFRSRTVWCQRLDGPWFHCHFD